jgi:hypothetical protein
MTYQLMPSSLLQQATPQSVVLLRQRIQLIAAAPSHFFVEESGEHHKKKLHSVVWSVKILSSLQNTV